jgi:uncharacterized membrane protein YjjB (DUF3815 family)
MGIDFEFLLNCLYAAVPALGFAMAFNVPSRQLVFCAIGGFLGYFVKFFLMHHGLHIIWSTFVASACVSFYGIGWGQKYRAHPKVITVAAIIHMIPGTFAYNTMVAVVAIASGHFTDQTLSAAAENGLKTLFILGGIAFGLASPSMLIYRKKPVV